MKRALVLAAAVAASLPGLARADAALEELLEQSIVSTASKSQETASSAPATSTTITADDLRRYGMHTLAEALNFLAMGVVVESSGYDAEIGVRGVHFTADYGDHVLLLVNGHAMNEQWDDAVYFDRGTGIPLEIVNHIEVILGPGSVLYGSNAMMAVINVVTKRAKDWEGAHAFVESELPVSIRAAGGFGRAFKLFGHESEVTLELEYYAQKGPSFDILPEHDHRLRFSLFGPHDGVWGGKDATRSNYAEAPSGYLRFFFGDLEVALRAAYWKRDSPFMNIDTFDDPNTFEVERWASGDVRYRAVLSPSVDLTSRLYADTYDYRQPYDIADGSDCVAGMPKGCVVTLDGVSRWLGVEEQLSIDWLKDGRIFTLVGLDARLRDVGSKTDYVELGTGRTPGSLDPYDLAEKALGAYAEQVVRPVKPLALNAGVRLDIDERFGAHASPRGAVTLSTWEGGVLKAIYSEAFRAPTAYERNYEDPGSQLAAPNLEPETVQSFEFAIDQRVGAQHGAFGIFRTEYDELVVETALTPNEFAAAKANGSIAASARSAYQYRNANSVEAYGFNAALDGRVARRLRYGASVTGALARQYDAPNAPGVPVSVSPEISGNARVSYELGGPLPTLAVATRVVGTRPADAAFTGSFTTVPYAPVLVETRVTVSGKAPFVPGLSYRASLNYVSAATAPYAVGPTRLESGAAQLAPIDRLRTSVGLAYDLPL